MDLFYYKVMYVYYRGKGAFSTGRVESPIFDDVWVWLRLRFLDRRTFLRSTLLALHTWLQAAASVHSGRATLSYSFLSEYLGTTFKSTFGKCT